jgi:LmbE family N-acetylglucosaminyl deacetylase
MPTVFAIAAHPDDIEFLMAGTLMRLAEAGWELHYWNLADGNCGSTVTDRETTATIRRGEAMEAAASIGAHFHESICHDLEIFYDKPTIAKVASVIREVRPRMILTHPPVDYMEDHSNTCRVTLTAAFTRGMPNFICDPPRPFASFPVTIYHAQPYPNRDPLGQIVRPQLAVDVSGLLNRKRAMLACHASQKRWLDESQGVDSYLDAQDAMAAEVGAMTGRFSHAEGFRKHLHIGYCEPEDDPLSEALGDAVYRF